MLSKRGLSPIVANVLIILLVIAAVGILWGVVRGLVDSGGEQIATQSDCLLINMEVTSCNNSSGVVNVRRNAGGPDVAVDFRVIPNTGNTVDGTGLEQVDNGNVTVNDATGSGKTVQVAAKLPDGSLCNPSQQPVACS